ncbi:hypothetical protein TI05_19220, partial [Achromatium sp. WMS3]
MLRIHANRGASGIDGLVSTLAGLAAGNCRVRTAHHSNSRICTTHHKEGAQCAPYVVGVIGDLALFHDLNGLYTLQRLNVILIVINNGGGGIFRYLSQTQLPNFERNWLTPTNLNIQQAAALFNLNYQTATCLQTFITALDIALNNSGTQLIEIIVDANLSVAQHKNYWHT